MKKLYTKLFILFLSINSITLFAQTQTWQWAFHAGDHGYESAQSVAMDGSGNVYITGPYTSAFINFGTFSLLNNTSGTADFFLVKFDATGTVAWAKTFGSLDGDQGNSVAVDAAGNIILTGWFTSPTLTIGSTVLTNAGTSSSDFFIAKFDPSGTLIWAKSAGGTVNDRGYAVSTDGNSNIYVTGWYSSPTINFGLGNLTNSGAATNDIFLVKYDANGNAQWSKTIGGAQSDGAYGLTTDAAGNSYLTGNYASASINFGTGALINAGSNTNDVFLTKYDAAGTNLWAARAGGIYDEIGNAVALNGNNLYVTGGFSSTSITFGSTAALPNASVGTNDLFLASYTTSGTANWSKRAGGTDAEEGKAVFADSNGNAYISGYFMSASIIIGTTTLTNYSAATKDLFVASFSSTSNPNWALAVGSSADEAGYGITGVPNASTIYLVGMFNSGSVAFGSNTIFKGCGDDVFYAKLDVTTGINEQLAENGFAIYPNPSSGVISISTELKNAQVEIYNVMGEKVYSNSHFENNIDLSSEAKGIYFVRLMAEGKVHSQRIIIE